MGNWTKVKDSWLETPEEEDVPKDSFRERGSKLLNSWFDNYFDKEKDETRVEIGVGFASDADTGENLGARIAVRLNGGERFSFTTKEMRLIVDFLNHLAENNPADAPNAFCNDLHGFIAAIEHGLEHAKVFEKGAIRH